MNWYLAVLKKYAVFEGRARRKEYWYFSLFFLIFSLPFYFIDGFTGTFDEETGYGLLSSLYTLAMLIPYFAVIARRLHDTNHSGWWGFVPLIGLIFLFLDSDTGDNRYGPSPKETLSQNNVKAENFSNYSHEENALIKRNSNFESIEKTNNPSSSDNIPMTMTETTSKDEHALLNSQHSENEHSSEDINTEFYATALNEIENETYDKGIWAKAFAECEGHETETNAKYIKLRAAQLQSTEWARQEAERLEAERIEAERLEPERLEAERLEAERIEAERLEAERIEAERLEAERIEASLKAIEAEEKNSNLGCLVFIIISMILFFIASK